MVLELFDHQVSPPDFDSAPVVDLQGDETLPGADLFIFEGDHFLPVKPGGTLLPLP